MTVSRKLKTREQKIELSAHRTRLLQRASNIATDRNVALSQRVGAGTFATRPQIDQTDCEIVQHIAELERSMDALGIEQIELSSMSTVEQLEQLSEQDPLMPDTMYINPAYQRHMLQTQTQQQQQRVRSALAMLASW